MGLNASLSSSTHCCGSHPSRNCLLWVMTGGDEGGGPVRAWAWLHQILAAQLLQIESGTVSLGFWVLFYNGYFGGVASWFFPCCSNKLSKPFVCPFLVGDTKCQWFSGGGLLWGRWYILVSSWRSQSDGSLWLVAFVMDKQLAESWWYQLPEVWSRVFWLFFFFFFFFFFFLVSSMNESDEGTAVTQ